MYLPDLETLRCFEASARLLSFSAAARVVKLTPAAVGQRIRQLEEQLATQLFQRTTRRVQLTEAGLRLLPAARRCLEAARACTSEARGDTAPTPAELTLGTRYELGLSWITPQLPDLGRRLPHLTLHLYFGAGEDLLARIQALTLDCAVTSTRISDPRIVGLPLHEEDYVFVATPGLLRRLPLRREEELSRHTLLDIGPDLPLFRYLREASGLEPRFARLRSLGTIAAIRELVLAGEGVAVLPRYLVAPDLRARRVKRLLPTLKLHRDRFRLAYRADDSRSSLFATLAKELLRVPLR